LSIRRDLPGPGSGGIQRLPALELGHQKVHALPHHQPQRHFLRTLYERVPVESQINQDCCDTPQIIRLGVMIWGVFLINEKDPGGDVRILTTALLIAR